MKQRERIAELESQQRINFMVCMLMVGVAAWALGNKMSHVQEEVDERARSETVKAVTDIIYHPGVRSHFEDVMVEWAKDNPDDAKRYRERNWYY